MIIVAHAAETGRLLLTREAKARFSDLREVTEPDAWSRLARRECSAWDARQCGVPTGWAVPTRLVANSTMSASTWERWVATSPCGAFW
jgi:hypothetical protein